MPTLPSMYYDGNEGNTVQQNNRCNECVHDCAALLIPLRFRDRDPVVERVRPSMPRQEDSRLDILRHTPKGAKDAHDHLSAFAGDDLGQVCIGEVRDETLGESQKFRVSVRSILRLLDNEVSRSIELS